MAESEKRFVTDKIVVIDEKAGTIITEENGPIPYDDAVKPYLERYHAGDKVNLTLYGDPERVMFIKKEGEFKTKKPEAPKSAKTDSEKKEQGYVLLNGKWYATLEVLLNKIHELYPGRHRIKTKPIKIDTEKKVAIFHTEVEIIDDEGRIIGSYEGTGDGDKDTLNTQMLPSYIRMAETRSIVRALRWATNIAEAAIDELPQEERGNKSTLSKEEYDKLVEQSEKNKEGWKGKTTLA